MQNDGEGCKKKIIQKGKLQNCFICVCFATENILKKVHAKAM